MWWIYIAVGLTMWNLGWKNGERGDRVRTEREPGRVKEGARPQRFAETLNNLTLDVAHVGKSFYTKLWQRKP
jgi:hypothetical protein